MQIDLTTALTDWASMFRSLADGEFERAARITPFTKERAFERGVALGRARAWLVCAEAHDRSEVWAAA